jgi:hypothetical protein
MIDKHSTKGNPGVLFHISFNDLQSTAPETQATSPNVLPALKARDPLRRPDT